jgi:hypothetical protein
VAGSVVSQVWVVSPWSSATCMVPVISPRLLYHL